MKKHTLILIVAFATVAGSMLAVAPPQAEAAGRRIGGFNRAWFAIERSRRLQRNSGKKTATNSIAHQMMWGGPAPGFYRKGR